MNHQPESSAPVFLSRDDLRVAVVAADRLADDGRSRVFLPTPRAGRRNAETLTSLKVTVH
jgi:hypothetical protein